MQGDFRIGVWRVQPQLNRITGPDGEIHLEPKVMEVLVYLAQHAGKVLPRDRLIQAVWPDTFVTDDVLTRAVSELRKAFGDPSKNPKIIETISKRGYRLVLTPVFEEGETSGPSPSKRSTSGCFTIRSQSGGCARKRWPPPPSITRTSARSMSCSSTTA